LASRLSAKGDTDAATELSDVQRLARQAVRDVRKAVAGSHLPSVEAELTAAEVALRTASIAVSIERNGTHIDPAHESTLAWAVREAATNVVKHSGAQTCRIVLRGTEGSTTLEVEDDGRGASDGAMGTGLNGIAGRVHALGGTLEVGPSDGQGFRLRVRLGAAATRLPNGEVAR